MYVVTLKGFFLGRCVSSDEMCLTRYLISFSFLTFNQTNHFFIRLGFFVGICMNEGNQRIFDINCL